MGVIGKIREKTGIAVGAIVIALAFFIVGGEFLTKCGNELPEDQNVATIDGEPVTIEEYRKYFESAETDISFDKGGAPLTDADQFRLKNEAWEKMLFDKVYQPMFQELGIIVTPEEFDAMVTGDHTAPLIRQIFQDPQSGQFNKDAVGQFLADFENKEPQIQQLWYNYKARLIPNRVKKKYETYVKKSVYTTKAEAERALIAQNTKAEANILYVPYYSIPDDSITVTDEDYQAYLDKNLLRYEQKEKARSVKFLALPIKPSAADTAAQISDMKALAEDFKEAENDSAFASLESDGKTPPKKVAFNTLPMQIQQDSAAIDTGAVFGPFLEAGRLKLYKIAEIGRDSVYQKHTASHILFKTDDLVEDTEKAQKKKDAQNVLRRALAGEDFAALAKEYSDDPGSKTKGGELGEIDENTGFVEPFKTVILDSKTPGIVDSLIETTFGYHILNVTQVKALKGTPIKYTLVTIERNINALEATRDSVLNFMNNIVVETEDTASFNKILAKDSTLAPFVQVANKITKDRNYMPGLSKPEEMVRWALSDNREVGDKSDVLEIDNKFVFGVITNKVNKGTPKLEDVKDEIRTPVYNAKKAEIILEKLSHLEGTLNERKDQYGSGAQIQNAKDVALSASNMPVVGQDPVAVGKLFALNDGDISEAFAGESGVIVLELVKKTTPEEGEELDINGKKKELNNARATREGSNVYQVVKEVNDIEDMRYKYSEY